eukprot:TRINITY_DN17309_c0_g1_i1.p1 TRINITY_DN17309_c0_g1~~TRINITY_DN17309_c0_g1_i1.p1  ORF type:complete len:509 (+),score=89.95 TRINITY_DN17309_c0_g1_i1:65-1591(+)
MQAELKEALGEGTMHKEDLVTALSHCGIPAKTIDGLLKHVPVASSGHVDMKHVCAFLFDETSQVATESSANLVPHHLACWQSNGSGGVDEGSVNRYQNPLAAQFPNMKFLNPREKVLGNIVENTSEKKSDDIADGAFRANATREIFWNPNTVKAAIVTCGGLCPGLNSIIREVTNCLQHQYGVKHILGMQTGYGGLSDPSAPDPIQLNSAVVREIHMKGGSILKAGRGGFDAPKICDYLARNGINMLFTVGGDGTQFASNQLFLEAKRRNLPVSIVGVPKSIDNDVLCFDKTFGFDTAVAEASEVIRSAWVEATSCAQAVGIVKLMGRDAGYVAMMAAQASTIVDLVMIPEVPVKIEDILAHVDTVIDRKGFMVLVVAEGAGQDLVATGKKDATGHTIYGDIGTYIRDAVNKHQKPKGGRSFYIDPSYIIRSVPIGPNDHVYCSRLARDAVHTAMRGYSGVCVGALHNVIVMLPSSLIAKGKRTVNPKSSSWQSCVMVCKMPSSLSGL